MSLMQDSPAVTPIRAAWRLHRSTGSWSASPQVSGFISVAVVTHPRGIVHHSRGVTAVGGRNSWSPHTHKSREKWMHTHLVLS